MDDNWFFAASLRLALDDDESLIVCDASPRPDGLEERIHHFRPHLLIFDLSIGQVSGLAVAQNLRDRGNRLPILFLSSQIGVAKTDIERIGNCAFLPKDKRPSRLIRLIKQMLDEADAREIQLRESSRPNSPLVAHSDPPNAHKTGPAVTPS